MSTIGCWTLTAEELEREGVSVMDRTVHALVTEGLIDGERAYKWLGAHTVVLRQLSWFSKIFKVADTEKEKEKYCWHIVKEVEDRGGGDDLS